jgi:hypothetical protein
MISINEGDLGEMVSPLEQEEIINDLRGKFAPNAIPKPQSQAEPLDLVLNLNSESAGPLPESEFDPGLTSAPPSPAVVVNILPVKRKVVPTQVAPPSNLPSSTTSSDVL